MKKNFKFNIPILAAILFGLSLAIGGCGGSGGGSSSSGTSLTGDSTKGRAQLTIKWPARKTVAGKLVPVASNSIVIGVSFNGAVVSSQTIVRPADGGPSTVFFTPLPIGQLGVTAAAFPNADGTGTAQASGSGTLAVTANKTATLTITMGSTITSLIINPSSLGTLPISGAAQALTVEALDASGNMVLVTPQTISWGTDAPTILNVTQDTTDTGATVTGLASGNGNIFVVETESQVSASLAVQVRGPLANLAITSITPQISMGGVMQFSIIATDLAGNTITSPAGLAWTSSNPLTAQINAQSGLCQGVFNAAITVSQTVTISVSATGVPTASAVLTVLPGSGTGTFLSPSLVTLAPLTQQQYLIYTGIKANNGIVWSIPDPNNLGSAQGSIDSNGLYTAPSSPPMVSGLVQQVTIQGITGGVTYTAKVSVQ